MPPIDGAAFEDRRSVLPGAALVQVDGGADAGEAGADDEHVEVFRRHERPRRYARLPAIERTR